MVMILNLKIELNQATELKSHLSNGICEPKDSSNCFLCSPVRWICKRKEMLMRLCADPLCLLQMVPAAVVCTYCSNIQTELLFIYLFLLSIACLPGNKNINVDVFSAEGEKRAQYSQVKILYEIILTFLAEAMVYNRRCKKKRVLAWSYILISLQTHTTLKFSLNISKKMLF